MTDGNIYEITKNCIKHYGLAGRGDRLLAGVSGGKDSLACLSVLSSLSEEIGFDISACFVAYPMKNLSKETEDFIRGLVPFYITETENNKKLSCNICSHIRRKALLETAKEKGCNKIVLAHNYEDNVETYLLNLFTGNTPEGLSPFRIYFDEWAFIRPFLWVKEKKIISFVQRNSVPVTKNLCPNAENCGRARIRKLLGGLKDKYPDIYENINRNIK